MMNMTPAVKQILIINILFFIGTLAVPMSEEILALHYFESPQFKIWQLFTHMFMHAGIAHIAFNMFGLISFGSALEHYWGSKKFVFFYLSCGLGAALIQLGVNYLEINKILDSTNYLNLSQDTLHSVLNVKFRVGDVYRGDLFQSGIKTILEKNGKWNLMNQESFNALYNAAIMVDSKMVGASGAIYGLLIAFAFMFPNAELMMIFLPIPIKAKFFVPILLALDLFSGVTGSSLLGAGIAHFAHLGGALIGFILMWYWRNNKFNHNRWN